MKTPPCFRKHPTAVTALVSAMTSAFVISGFSLAGQVLPCDVSTMPTAVNGMQGEGSMPTLETMPPCMVFPGPEMMRPAAQPGLEYGTSSRSMQQSSWMPAPRMDGQMPPMMQDERREEEMRRMMEMKQRIMEENSRMQNQTGEHSSFGMQFNTDQMPVRQTEDEMRKMMEMRMMEMKKRMMPQNQNGMYPMMEGQNGMRPMMEGQDGSMMQGMPMNHPAAGNSDGMMNTPPAGFEDVITEPETKNWFSDVSTDDPVGEAANFLATKGVVGGYPDGTFQPGKTINRAETAKFLLLARIGTVPETGNSGMFWDVKDGQWYTKFVVTAANMGIIGGYKDRSFNPGKTVNTAEFLKMLSLAFHLEASGTSSYDDVPADAWFASFAAVAEEHDLLPERVGSLQPESPITRGEAVYAIAKVMQGTDQQ